MLHNAPGLKIAYVLKMFPRLSETFVLNEILELERCGCEVVIFSLKKPNEGRFHPRVSQLKARVIRLSASGLGSAQCGTAKRQYRPSRADMVVGVDSGAGIQTRHRAPSCSFFQPTKHDRTFCPSDYGYSVQFYGSRQRHIRLFS
jgi:hypothetical protein